MKKLVLVITTVTLVVTMVFSVGAKTKVKSIKVKTPYKNPILFVGDIQYYKVKIKAPKKFRGFKVKSSNKKVVKVTKDGNVIKVKALKKGKAKITVTSTKAKTKKYKFNIKVWLKPTINNKTISRSGRKAEDIRKEEEDIKKQQEAYKIHLEKQAKAEEQAKIFEEQGLVKGEDYYIGMGNDDQGMICVLLYKQTYIDDELLADFNKDKAEVEEKIKTDPNYQINKSSVYFKEKDVYYKIWQTNYCLFFRNNIYIEYGCYNDTGELPTPEHYDYKMVNGIIVEGTYYWPYEIEYKEHKYITSIGYDQNGNLTEISKSTTS